jgi:Asp-tRNA(Asn)/Glu-tRNA(Gln) amidotransferase A subunit family amidase
MSIDSNGENGSMIWSDASEQARAIRKGGTSSVELTSAYLLRIARFNEKLRSFVAVDEATALASAKVADAGALERPDEIGPLHGVPISVKDVIDVAGMATTHSSKALVDNVSLGDDPLVQRFREAGMVIIGKTNSPSSVPA